jgi:hypothetical protein
MTSAGCSIYEDQNQLTQQISRLGMMGDRRCKCEHEFNEPENGIGVIWGELQLPKTIGKTSSPAATPGELAD